MADHDSYYHAPDLGKFGEMGDNRKELADKFFAWYGAVFADGALSVREKSLIALAVAHAVQCPYCSKRFTRKTPSTRLNKHQDGFGNACYGRVGIRVF